MKTRSQTKQAKNGRKQYHPSVRERKKKKTHQTPNTQTLSRKVGFALYCSASFPSILATAPGAANQGPGGGREHHRRVTAVHCPPVTAPGETQTVHAAPLPQCTCWGWGQAWLFFPLLQQGLANNLGQILPSSPPPALFHLGLQISPEGGCVWNLWNEVTERKQQKKPS